MKLSSKIMITGSTGMVGSALVRVLTQKYGYKNLITISHKDIDLTQQKKVDKLFADERPEYVFNAAAKVGGIKANIKYPAEFIYTNLMIQTNVIHAAYKYNVKKLLFLGSSCIYPREAPQPLKEEYLLSGKLEPTNQAYAIAKIAGIQMCEAYHKQYGCNFISVMPTNLYGYGDNFNLENAHVLAAFIHKFHIAKENGNSKVICWGTGNVRREFLFVDDAADAMICIMKKIDAPAIVNIGTGEDITIKELASIVARIVGFKGEIIWDTSQPEGTPRKLLDISILRNLGWSPQYTLEEGIRLTYEWFKNNYQKLRK